MDLITHIPGVGPTASFSPGASTPAPYNVPHTGTLDGLGPGTATKNMAELYNRDLLWRRALIAAAGLGFDPNNWVQEVAAVQAIVAAAIAASISVPAPLGQCRLSKSGVNLLLLPYNGNQITIAGVAQTIPDAGVTLAPTALAANTSYYIYAYMVGAVMTLEASATGHSTSTTAGNKGVEIKTGDNTRTLVGLARIITGIAWQDAPQQRFVLSWFNRRQVPLLGAYTVVRTISSATYGELNSEIRCEYLTWADEAVDAQLQAQAYNATSGTITYTGIALDSSTVVAREVSYIQQTIVGTTGTAALQLRGFQAEGYHFVTLLGKVSGSTGNWYADSTVSVMVRG